VSRLTPVGLMAAGLAVQGAKVVYLSGTLPHRKASFRHLE
jgi:hypothetical protein